jgi:hypothetical protein
VSTNPAPNHEDGFDLATQAGLSHKNTPLLATYPPGRPVGDRSETERTPIIDKRNAARRSDRWFWPAAVLTLTSKVGPSS